MLINRNAFGYRLENSILNLYFFCIVVDFLFNDDIPSNVQSVL